MKYSLFVFLLLTQFTYAAKTVNPGTDPNIVTPTLTVGGAIPATGVVPTTSTTGIVKNATTGQGVVKGSTITPTVTLNAGTAVPAATGTNTTTSALVVTETTTNTHLNAVTEACPKIEVDMNLNNLLYSSLTNGTPWTLPATWVTATGPAGATWPIGTAWVLTAADKPKMQVMKCGSQFYQSPNLPNASNVSLGTSVWTCTYDQQTPSPNCSNGNKQVNTHAMLTVPYPQGMTQTNCKANSDNNGIICF